MAEFKFTPKQWVLTRDEDGQKWGLDIFSYLDVSEEGIWYNCIGGLHLQCIPYDGNERLLNTTNDYVGPWQPKKYGDFVAIEETHPNGDKAKWICILDVIGMEEIHFLVGLDSKSYLLRGGGKGYYRRDHKESFRLATEEEKQLLLSKLAEIGKKWNPEKKCIEDIYQPKDGDFVYVKSLLTGTEYIFIKKVFDGCSLTSHFVLFDVEENALSRVYETCCLDKDIDTIRLATDSEKQQLLDALHKEGKDWDESKKEIVEYKWKPVDGEEYHYCKYNDELNDFEVETTKWHALYTDTNRRKANNCFKEFIECSNACDRMNESFKELLKGGKE